MGQPLPELAIAALVALRILAALLLLNWIATPPKQAVALAASSQRNELWISHPCNLYTEEKK